MKIKTKKIKDMTVYESKYVCQCQDLETCSKCPLHIDIENTQKLVGCYPLLKMILDKEGEKTITL